MKIAIIGTGKVGGALAKSLSKAGHQILLGSRSLDGDEVQQLVKNLNVSAHTVSEASKLADVIIIAAVPAAVSDIANQIGDVSQKVIIDAMNSFSSKPEPYNNTFEALKALTNCSNLVKCFNTTGFENMADPIYDKAGIDMFAAGNSEKAKAIATQLSKDAGFSNCYDFGGDDKVQLLEYFGLSWVNLAIMQKHGRNIAFKLIRRE